ncbi:WXG100 family type VII secretion target [Paenibacillus sp. GCM10028914]|uniref:WXG100 family type VII secretion target n=1 Tax=Paenibacillus sp. GCM10028914 TaxID=3273416 RepID=UPI003610C2E7
MSKILVPPEVLMQVAEKFRLESLQMEWRISSLDHQMDTMLMWEGTTRQNFFENYKKARSDMTKTIEHMRSISEELKAIAHRFKLVDEDLLHLALVGGKEEPKEWYEEAWDSVKELGNGIMAASNERYDKRYSSVWSFLDYWTAGIPKGAYQGYVERADKLFDSRNDFANGMTFGVHGTIREAILPTNAWSTEHVANMIGAAGIVAGVTVPLMKPKDVLIPSVKYEVGPKGNDGVKHDSGGDGGGTPRKAEGPSNGNALSTTVNSDNTELMEHLVDGHGIGRKGKPSVKGAHNLDSFYKIIDEEAASYGLNRSDFIIGDPKPHPQIEGLFEIKYRIPSLETDYVNGGTKLKLDNDGVVVYKAVQRPKTVYGPPITNEEIVRWSQEAVNGVEKAGTSMVEGVNRGVALNGLKFEWLIVDGKINSIYPVF